MTDERKQNNGFLKAKTRATYNAAEDILVELPPFPRIILIELTNACNHGCSFCYNKRSTRGRGMIDGALLTSVLTDAYQLGAREVGFYATGESLLNRHVDEYVKLASQLGFEYIYLTTNGALLSPDRTESLFLAGMDSIKFSINAATRETYELVHGQDDFDTVMRNLTYLREYRDNNSANVKIGVSYVLTHSNRHERSLAEEKIGKLVDDIVFHNAGNQGGYMNTDYAPRVSASAPCPMIFNRFHVSQEGYFTLCCVDYQNYLAIADLNQVSLSAAWTSDAAIGMRRRHLTSDLKGTFCHNCIMGKNNIVEPLVKQYSTVFDFKS